MKPTLSLIENIDPVGTIALPALLVLLWLIDSSNPPLVFAFAKPLLVNTSAADQPRVASLMVHGAGIVANAAMAVAASGLLYLVYFLPGGFGTFFVQTCRLLVLMNLVLICFHLIPFPPFDLGRILFGHGAWGVDENRIRTALLGVGGLVFVAAAAALWQPIDFNPIAYVLWPPAEFLYNRIQSVLHALYSPLIKSAPSDSLVP